MHGRDVHCIRTQSNIRRHCFSCMISCTCVYTSMYEKNPQLHWCGLIHFGLLLSENHSLHFSFFSCASITMCDTNDAHKKIRRPKHFWVNLCTREMECSREKHCAWIASRRQQKGQSCCIFFLTENHFGVRATDLRMWVEGFWILDQLYEHINVTACCCIVSWRCFHIHFW
jgi:hypothetical protein